MYRHNNKRYNPLGLENGLQDILLTHAMLATLQPGTAYGLIEDGAVAIRKGRIEWCGKSADIPKKFNPWPERKMNGALITPSLIDCHTHIVYGGNRAKEFEKRLSGVSYEDIARQGGGIISTVKATRETHEDALLASALVRVDRLLSEGVSCIEIKSGYGLDIETELKMLRTARRIAEVRDVRIRTSFLGAHALPPEYKNKPDQYIDEVCLKALRAAHKAGLVDAVDGFCETIGFTKMQIMRVFDAARALGLPVKLHAEQLSHQGGAAMTAEYKGLSADHLEYLDMAGVTAMAAAGTVAVLLPGAYYFLRDITPPPIDALRKAGVPIAVATDCNPGSSPLTSLLLAMNMACTLFRMTPEEALTGATRHAATALGLTDTGTIIARKRADLSIWDAAHPSELSYHFGHNLLKERLFGADI